MITPLRRATRTLACASIVLLGGCAALELKVDVYQGPFSQPDELHTEQLVAMTVAAEPLLQRLEFELEKAWRQENCEGDAPRPGGRAAEILGADDADLRRVCKTFYDPELRLTGTSTSTSREPRPLGSTHARRVRAVLELYESADHDVAQIVRETTDVLETFRYNWRTFGSEDVAEEWNALKARTRCEDSADHEFKDRCQSLKQAYAEFLDPDSDYRTMQSLWDEWGLEEEDEDEDEKGARSVPFFDELIDEGRRRDDAAVLFSDSKDQQTFVDLVLRTGHAFLKARRALFRLEHRLLESLAFLPDDYAWHPLNRRLIDAAAKALVTIFPSWVESELRDMEVFASDCDADCMQQQIRDEPRATARALLDAEREFRLDASPDTARRRYGFAASLSESDADLEMPLDASYAIFEGGIGVQGLRRGRQPKGLYDRIDDWYEARARSSGGEEARLELERELVAFAEKLRFVANKEPLLAEAPTIVARTSGPRGRGRTRTADTRAVFDDRFIIVLQEVGNSILSYAGDMARRRSHERAQLAQGRAEARAYTAAFTERHVDRVGRFRDHLEALAVEVQQRADAAEDDEQKQTLEERIALLERMQRLPFLTTMPSEDGPEGFLEHVGRLIDEAAGEDETASFARPARTVLGAFVASSLDALDGFPGPGSEETPTAVLDQLAMHLEYQYIRVLSEQPGGESSAAAERLQAAIEEVWRHRASRLYIRPASAFLRSSFPASELSAGDGEARNLLARGMLLSPFRGWGGEPADTAVLRSIDAQHWHTINTVRLRGTGDTNYVVVKDDVGNWYVKNYSAEQDEIADAITGLGRFALRGRTGLDVFGEGRTPDAAADGDAGEDTPAPGTRAPTGIAAVVARHRDAYAEATATDYASVRGWFVDDGAGLGIDVLLTRTLQAQDDVVVTAFQDAADPFHANLDAFADENLPEPGDDPPAASVTAGRITDALWTLKRSLQVLETALAATPLDIETLELTETEAEALRTRAARAVGDALRVRLERMIERRLLATGRFEEALRFSEEVVAAE